VTDWLGCPRIQYRSSTKAKALPVLSSARPHNCQLTTQAAAAALTQYTAADGTCIWVVCVCVWLANHGGYAHEASLSLPNTERAVQSIALGVVLCAELDRLRLFFIHAHTHTLTHTVPCSQRRHACSRTSAWLALSVFSIDFPQPTTIPSLLTDGPTNSTGQRPCAVAVCKSQAIAVCFGRLPTNQPNERGREKRRAPPCVSQSLSLRRCACLACLVEPPANQTTNQPTSWILIHR